MFLKCDDSLVSQCMTKTTLTVSDESAESLQSIDTKTTSALRKSRATPGQWQYNKINTVPVGQML